jgi:hypothetical protein
VVVTLAERTDVILTESETYARADKPRRSPVERLPPILLRPEDRPVIEPHIFVNKDGSLVDQVRPEVSDAGREARLDVDVEEGEEDRRVVMWQGRLEPASDELTALDAPFRRTFSLTSAGVRA